MDFTSFEAFVESMIIILDQYAFILVILFAFIHPLFEGPLALFTLSLGIILLGPVIAFPLIFAFNILGSMLLFYLLKKVDKFSNYYLHRKKVSNDVLDWLQRTKKWKHVFVLGVPIIPTYPVKIGYLLSEPKFKEGMITMIFAYLFLFFGNTLIYYGVLTFLESGTSRVISIIILLVLVLFVYFGNDIFKKIGNTKEVI